jgi:menaquinone-dependent protoporphyrinogen IX oxidase
MKGIVAYDSVHGNTKAVAEAIAEQIRSEGHQAELVSVREGGSPIEGDFMFLGSPTRMSRATGEAREFVEKLDREYWRSRPIVIFDTVGPLSKDAEKRKKWLGMIDEGAKNAASQLRELSRSRGLNVHSKILHLAVTGFKGPLASDALQMAREFTHQFLTEMK